MKATGDWLEKRLAKARALVPGPDAACELCEIACAFAVAGNMDRARAAFKAAEMAAKNSSHPRDAWETQEWIAFQFAEKLVDLERFGDAMAVPQTPLLGVRTVARVAARLVRRGELRRARSLFEKSEAAARGLRGQYGYTSALGHVGLRYAESGWASDAGRVFKQALAAARRERRGILGNYKLMEVAALLAASGYREMAKYAASLFPADKDYDRKCAAKTERLVREVARKACGRAKVPKAEGIRSALDCLYKRIPRDAWV